MDVECADAFGEVACLENSECSWTGAVCVEGCKGRGEKVWCETLPVCFWDAATNCSAKADDECRRWNDEASCPEANCTWSPITGCVPKEAVDSTLCAAQQLNDCLSFSYCDLSENGTLCVDRVESGPPPVAEDPCGFDSEQACLEASCIWTDLPASSSGVCTSSALPGCRTFFTAPACQGAVVGCVFFNQICYDTCSLSNTAAQCLQAGCVYSPLSQPKCTRGDVEVTCSTYSNEAECRVSGLDPPCTYDASTRACRTYEPGECGFATESQTCLDHAADCGWSDFTTECRTCADAASQPDCASLLSCSWDPAGTGACGKTVVLSPVVFSVELSLAIPMPGVPFAVTLRGVSLSEEDRVAVIQQGTVCPLSIQGYPTTLIGGTASGLVSRAITVANSGMYRFCYFSSAGKTPLQATDAEVFPSFEVKHRSASSLSLSYLTQPYSGAPFAFVVSGHYLKSTDRFIFTAQDQACPTDLSTYTRFLAVTSSSAEGVTIVSIGAWILCYASIALQSNGLPDLLNSRVIPLANDPVVVAQFVDYLAVDVLEDAASNLSNSVGFDIAAFNAEHCDKDHERGPRLVTQDILGHHWGPVVRLDGSAGAVRFGTIGGKRYLRDQACIIPVVPETSVQDVTHEATGDRGHLQLSFATFAVDETDLVMVFADSDVSAVGSVLGSTVRTDLAPDAVHPNCPAELLGHELVASYSGRQLQPMEKIRVGFSVDEARGKATARVFLVICTDGADQGGTGLALDVAVAPRCPKGCTDQEGVVRGVCNVVEGEIRGVCACSTGWSGEDCGERVVCRGRGAEVSPRTAPGSAVDTQMAALSTCGFWLKPNPALDASLTRFTTFHVVIEVVSAASFSSDCSTDYLLVFSDSYQGTLLNKICATDLTAGGFLQYVPAREAYVEASASLGGRFAFRYKVVSTVCPGELGPSGVPTPETECSGRGNCVTRPLTERFAAFPTHAKMCECSDEYAAQTVGSSCDVCAFGYRAVNGSECSNQTTCATLDECGGTARATTCSAKGCICKEPYFGADCSVTVPGAVREAIAEKELGSSMMLRFSFEDGVIANVGGAVRGIPDTARLACTEDEDSPCLQSKRFRGNVYGEERRLADGTSAGNGLYLNKEAPATNVFSDHVIVSDIAGTGMDVESSFTVSAWVRVSRATSGVLVAKVDNVVYKNGQSVALSFAVPRMVVGESEGPAPLEPRVYFAVYLDGNDGSVTYFTSQPSDIHGAGEEGTFARKFRVGDSLFDANWHYMVLSIGSDTGRFEGQVFIDGRTSTTDASYVQCLPSLPASVVPGVPSAAVYDSNFGVPVAAPGGLLVFGYNFSGTVDEVRLYDARLTHYTVVEIGSMELFEGELSLASRMLIAMAVLALVFLGGIVAFSVAMRLLRGQKENLLRNLRRGASQVVPILPAESPRALGVSGINVTVNHSETASNLTRDPSAEKPNLAASGFVKDPEFCDSQSSQDDKFEDNTALPLSRQETYHDTTSYRARLITMKVKATIIRDTWQMLALLLTSWDWPPLFNQVFGYISHPISLDVLHLSSGQGKTGGRSTFEWAFYAGSAACMIGVVALGMIVTGEKGQSADVMQRERKAWRDIMRRWRNAELQAEEGGPDAKDILERARVRKTEELKAAGFDKRKSDRIASVAVLLISTMYLPVTRGAIMVMRCHRDVQCIWDCASLSDTDASYRTAFTTALAMCIVVSIGIPLFFCYVTFRKMVLFDALHPNRDTRADDWIVFTREDRTSYKDVYSGFEYRWAYFQVYLMLFKATMCMPALGLEKNGADQLIVAVVILGVFTFSIFAATPFIVAACDHIMQVGQVNIMVCIAVCCFYRVNPSSDWYGLVLIWTSGFTLVAQLWIMFSVHSTKLSRAHAGDRRQSVPRVHVESADGSSCEGSDSAGSAAAVDPVFTIVPQPSGCQANESPGAAEFHKQLGQLGELAALALSSPRSGPTSPFAAGANPLERKSPQLHDAQPAWRLNGGASHGFSYSGPKPFAERRPSQQGAPAYCSDSVDQSPLESFRSPTVPKSALSAFPP
ncbi:hypothetical protein DIPPA_31406 [Diplonema papillatum]|nr:hypothetical protein DIPPA_31406 [Diplonema papillatum]